MLRVYSRPHLTRNASNTPYIDLDTRPMLPFQAHRLGRHPEHTPMDRCLRARPQIIDALRDAKTCDLASTILLDKHVLGFKILCMGSEKEWDGGAW